MYGTSLHRTNLHATVGNGQTANRNQADAALNALEVHVPTAAAATAPPTCFPIQRRYPAHPASVARVRRAIADAAQQGLLGPAGVELTDTLLLIASELVTNAITHAGDDDTDRLVEVTTWAADHHLWLAVADSSPDTPTRCAPDADSTHGRGLLLVDLLTAVWGSTPRVEGVGKVVFAGLRL